MANLLDSNTRRYNSFTNVLKSNTSDYNSFTKDFNYDIGFKPLSSDSTYRDLYGEALQRSWQARIEKETPRSLLDRTFDTLMLPLYATAGVARGFVDNLNGKDADDISPWEGFVTGLQAGNPFGKGYEKGEHTYSRVLESAGWKPESTFGKIAKGTLGFGLDVLLDPTTYLTFGASAALKGSGKIGALASSGLKHFVEREGLTLTDDLSDVVKQAYEKGLKKFEGKDVNPNLVERYAQRKAKEASEYVLSASKMTLDEAEDFVRSKVKGLFFKGIHVSPEQVRVDAKKFMDKYNKLRGFQDEGHGINLSLGNLPFGEKIFGKNLSSKRITLVDDVSARAFGDKTLAPIYGSIRDQIYGSKIGELLSTTSPLYRYAKSEPKKLFDFMKFVDHVKGLNLDKVKSEEMIRNKARAFNLTPAENKEVLRLLQDATIWNKVKGVVKFAETQEGKRMRKVLEAERVKVEQEFNELRKMRESINDARKRDVSGLEDELAQLEKEYNQRIIELDSSHFKTKAEKEQYLKLLEEQLSRYNNVDDSLTSDSIMKKYDSIIKLNKEDRELTNKAYRDLAKQKRKYSEINKNAPLDVQKAERAEIDAHNLNIEEQMLRIRDESVATSVHEVIDDLNKLLFNGEKVIPYAGSYGIVSDVIAMMKNGEELEYIKYVLSKNDSLQAPHIMEKNKFIASLLGYDNFEKDVMSKIVAYQKGDTELPNKIVAHIKNKYKDKGINPELINRLAKSKSDTITKTEYEQLMRVAIQRSELMQRFRNAHTIDDVMEVKTRIMNEEIYKGIDDVANYKYGKLPNEDVELNDLDYEVDARTVKKYKSDGTRQSTPDTERFTPEKEYMGHQDTRILEAKEDIAYLQESLKKAVSEDDIQSLNKQIKELNKYITSLTRPKSEYGDFTLTGSEEMRFILDLSKKQKWNVKKFLDERTPFQKMYYEEAKKVAQDLLDNTYHRSYAELTDGQKYHFHKAIFERLEKNKELNRMVKENQKSKDIIRENNRKMAEKARKDIEAARMKKSLFEEGITRKADLLKKIESVSKELTDADITYKETRESLVASYKKSIDEQKQRVDDVNTKFAEMRKALRADDEEKFVKLNDEMKRLDDLIANDDALENYAELTLGKNAHSRITESEKILLDDMPIDDKVKNIVRVLRGEFIQIAEEEVKLRKLSQEQLDEMMWKYVTRILTPEGAKFFATRRGNELLEKQRGLTKDLGFGVKFNPYQKKRKFKYLPDEQNPGAWIKDPTIEQLNEFFEKFLKGKNAYVDNVADIYIHRAMKHNELMYDDHYMRNMMDVFGEALPPNVYKAKEGYKTVINYGMLKDAFNSHARRLLGAHIKANQLDLQKMKKEEVFDLYKSIYDQTITETGIPRNLLGASRVPMVELNEQQVQQLLSIIPTAQVRQVNDAIVMKANQARKLQIMKDESRFLQIYDKITHLLKLNMTTVMPSFHMRNAMANKFLGWLNVGGDAVNLDLNKKAFQTVRSQGKHKLDDVIIIRNADGSIGSIRLNEAYEMAKAHGVIDEGFFAKDIGSEARTTGVIKGVPSKYDPTDSENFILYRKGAEVGSTIENTDRFLVFLSHLKNGKSVEEASDMAREALFDYGDLTAFEQRVLKRIFPFYTWLRKNSVMQLRQLILQPEKYQLVAKTLNGIEGMNNEEDMMDEFFVNDFARDWIQTPFRNPDGEPILWNPNLPFNDLARIPDPTRPIDSIKSLFTQSNPIIKVPTEQAMNKNVFFDSEIADKSESAGTQLAQRADHILNQLALYGAGSGIVEKHDDDLGLHLLNLASGVKFMSYDYENYRRMKMQELAPRKSYASIMAGISALPTSVAEFNQLAVAGGFASPSELPIGKQYAPPSVEELDRIQKEAKMIKDMVGKENGDVRWSYVSADKLVPRVLDADVFDSPLSKYVEAKVTKVKDGDTIRVRSGDSEFDVRMLLIDTPETTDPRKPVMPFGIEASTFSKSVLSGKNVRLYFDGTEEDKYGRKLAYIWYDGVDFNKTLVDQGYARVSRFGEEKQYDSYSSATRDAERDAKGVWSIPGYVGQEQYNTNYISRDVLDALKEKYKEISNR